MSFYFIIPLLALIVNNFVWVYIYAQRKPNHINIGYLLLGINISIGLGIEAITWLPIQPDLLVLLAHLNSFTWLAMGFFLLNFTYSFLQRKYDAPYVLVLILTIITVIIGMFTNLIKTEQSSYAYWGGLTNNGPLHIWAVLIVVYIPFIYALALLIRKQRTTADPQHRRQLSLIIIGTISSITIALITNILIPKLWEIHDFIPLAGSATVILNIFLFVAVYKYNLLQLSIEKVAPDIFAGMREGIIVYSLDHKIIEINTSARNLLGATISDQDILKLITSGKVTGEHDEKELSILHAEGTLTVACSHSPLTQQGKPIGNLYLLRDVSSNKEAGRLEEQIFHLQKMESIGRLAGGIAHDFNNMLGIISGFAEMLQYKYNQEDNNFNHYTNTIINTCKRAGELTSKLLAFARKGAYTMKTVDLHTVLNETIDILKHTLDKRIHINASLIASATSVRCDTGQLQNAFLNMAINAQDAMPKGGDLSLTTHLTEIKTTAKQDRPYVIVAGTYITISIADTGMGMDAETKLHIFEPFFTTKKNGKGTGLGLASVYGTVKSHGGFIEIESSPGKGSVFHVSLPLTKTITDSTTGKKIPATENPTSGTIMLIDDEEYVREVLSEMLTFMGYRVIACSGCQEALPRFSVDHTSIDLVLLDVMMPECDGLETLQQLKEVDPQVKVVIASGYSKDGKATAMLNEGALEFLSKPFTLKKLQSILASYLPRA